MSGTKLAGVIGWPIGHSLSPVLHKFWLEEHEIDGEYVPIALRPEDFSAGVDGLRRAGFTGVNVTTPHKQSAFAFAHAIDNAALRCRAANLLIFAGDGFEARNTDAAGLFESVTEELGTDFVVGEPALILGAGGAARAAILAVDRLGAAEICVFNRTESRARDLAQGIQRTVHAKMRVISPQNLHKTMESAALLVNATSGGMRGRSQLDLDLHALRRDAAVVDLIYNPLQTMLLKNARARGHPCMNGMGMLIHQGADSFDALFGVRPTVTRAVRAKLERVLAS